MEIIIKMPDHIYNTVIETGKFFPYRFNTVKAIKNGTVIPKGHGRLKDIDWINENCEGHRSEEDGSRYYAWKDIDRAQTIIDADTENRDK